MTPRCDEIALEQRHVDEMYARLDCRQAEAEAARRRATASITADPVALFARDVELDRLARLERALGAAQESLCFGRLDGSDGGVLHIGRIGLSSPDGEQLLVDWRADAARPFYEATPVSALGLRRRRHLRLTDRRVTAVSDEILDGSLATAHDLVGDGPLVEVLQTARTGRMRQAVATLQTEQDAIIRSPERGIVVVDGGPGTGKTIVALHRAAYVLYAFPDLTRRGVLIYGPNRRFLDYISDVLPSLGENDVSLATLADLTGVEPGRTDPDDVARLKGSAAIAAGLQRWVREHQPDGSETLDVRVGSEVVVLPREVVQTAHRLATKDGLAHNLARAVFTELVVDELVTSMEAATGAELARMDAEISGSLGLDLDKAVADDLRALGLDDDVTASVETEIDWDALRERLLDDSAVDLAVERIWPRLDPARTLRTFLTDHLALARLVPELTSTVLQQFPDALDPALSAADLPLLDEVRTLIDGPAEQLYGHVVVDEAQELSEMEWRVVMRRRPTRSLTIVGDFAQAGSASRIRSWSQALGPFSGGWFVRHTLTVNYRTTAEILDEAAPILAEIAPHQELSRSIRRGDRPRHLSVCAANLNDLVRQLVNQTAHTHPGELIGVIGPAGRAPELSRALGGTGAQVAAAVDARGLEFDTVLVIDPTGIRSARPSGINDLYVALTRATKHALIVNVEH